MPDNMARALGANGATTVTIAGKECTVRPLGLKELTEVERECLRGFKKSFLETYFDSVHLFPKDQGMILLRQKMDEAAMWDIGDLPPKFAHDSSKISLPKSLKKWLSDQFGVDSKVTDAKDFRQLCATALDQKTLTGKQYTKFTGEKAPRQKVPYVNWWITGSFEGMLSLVYICFKHNGVSYDEVSLELSNNPSLLSSLSREIEHLSAPDAKNG